MADILIGNVKGPQGNTGATGPQGAKGDAATIAVGSVTTTQYGQTARVTNSGTSSAAVFDFVIPQGKPGEQVSKIDNLVIDAITEPSTTFPVPAIGDNGSTLFGKITKWFSDMVARVNTVQNSVEAVPGVIVISKTSETAPITVSRGTCALIGNKIVLVDIAFAVSGTIPATVLQYMFYFNNRSFARSSDLMCTKIIGGGSTSGNVIIPFMADAETHRIGVNGGNTSQMTSGTSWNLTGIVFLT